MKERFRLGDGAEKVTSLQMTKGLIQALGWKKVVDENFVRPPLIPPLLSPRYFVLRLNSGLAILHVCLPLPSLF